MIRVEIPAAMSLSIITSFLFHLSTNAPATGYSRMFGKAKASPTIARAVASPVTCHAQIVRAKFVMKVPRRLTNWPPQITVNPRIPERKGCLLDSVNSINTC